MIKIESTNNRVMQIKEERNIYVLLMLLPVKHNIDLLVTFSYALGPIPFSLATPDGNLQ